MHLLPGQPTLTACMEPKNKLLHSQEPVIETYLEAIDTPLH